MVETRETALYYPTIEPPGDWLRRSLLLYDGVTTMVPDGDPQDYVTEELEFLWKQAGVWTPTIVARVSGDDYLDDIDDVISSYLTRPQNQRSASWTREPKAPTPIFIGKLTEEVGDRLRESNLPIEQSDNMLLVPQEVADMVLAVTAKYYVSTFASTEERLVASTDGDLNYEWAYGHVSPDGRGECLQLLLQDLLPVPHPDTPIAEIVNFRSNYRDEVVALRVALDDLIRTCVQAEDSQKGATARQELSARMSDVTRAAESRRIRLLSGVSTMLLFTAGAAAAGSDVLASFVAGVASSGALELAKVAARRPKFNEFSYAMRCQRDFAAAT